MHILSDIIVQCDAVRILIARFYFFQYIFWKPSTFPWLLMKNLDRCHFPGFPSTCRKKLYFSRSVRTMDLYKNTIKPGDYVKNKNLSKYSRSLLAQFRCGILPLEVEIGRFRNIPLENRQWYHTSIKMYLLTYLLKNLKIV